MDKDMNNQMSNMRDMYRDNHNMGSNMMDHNSLGQDMSHNMMGQGMSHNMMGKEMRLSMRDMHRQNQAFGPNQYFKKDDMGNYVYSYNDQQSEKSEEGNDQFIKGNYAYIMSNGVKRRVEYIADKNGFHIIKDNADPARIKRSSEPDLLQARMTSVMDSSSLRDDGQSMNRMSNLMGRDMSSQMRRNLMGMDQQRYSNMMGRNTMVKDSIDRKMMGQVNMGLNMMGQENMGHNMIDQDNMGRNMMGRNIYNIMSNNGMPSDMSGMMGKQDSSMMGQQDMTVNVMGQNMIGQDRLSQMMRPNMMGHQDMTPNMMYSNMRGQDMMDRANNQMTSSMMRSNSNNRVMGQRMMQQMEMERTPETYTSTRFF